MGYELRVPSVSSLEIKQFIRYKEIRLFSMMVNKFWIYDKDSRAIYAHYKSVSEKRSGSQNHGKPYGAPYDKGKWRGSGGKETSGGGNYVCLKCFMAIQVTLVLSSISQIKLNLVETFFL